ncbi:MAG: DUF2889 domain-containing protein [Stellaceae bacterium]
MPLSPPTEREPIHRRVIECRGYRRADGMWDIEGHLTDTKSYDFDSQFRGAVAAGTPVHQMWLRLTVDDELAIRDVEAVTDHSPFPICGGITGNFAKLKGLSIRPGFNAKVRELLGGVEGCTHLVEMLGPVATTAFQTIYPYRERLRRLSGQAAASPRRVSLLNTCHGWSSKGEVVKRLYPELYTGE